MKNKLMMILILLGVQTSIQANWLQDMRFYYTIARHIALQKIKSLNPFGKAVAVSDENYSSDADDADFLDDDFDFKSQPPKKPKFKNYRKKYTKTGKRISYSKKKKR